MKINLLCIETTTEICSVCLQTKNGVFTVSSSEKNAHSTELTVLIEKLLQEHHISYNELNAIAYSSGPGSYTGLRIGLSVAKGICYGTTIPLISIPTLKHWTNINQNASKYIAMMDARRNEIFMAVYDSSKNEIIPPTSILIDQYNWNELIDSNTIIIGNGISKTKSFISDLSPIYIEEPVSAETMISLANEKWTNKEFADLAYETPFYLKDANVTLPKKK